MLYKKVNGWKNISPEKAEQVFTMGEEYKKVLDIGKTERELEKEEEKRRKEEELKIAKDANRISIISMIFSGLAIIISILSYLKE